MGPRFFFRRDNRLQKRSEFLAVYAQAKVCRRRGVHVFVMAREASDLPTRLGITATRKVGNAVQRNRLKRRAREIFRLHLPRMKPGYTTVVNFQRVALQMHFRQVEKQLLSAWSEAGMLCDEPESQGDESGPQD